MKRLLPLFTYIFHPLFISVYATLFYFIITKNFFYHHEIYLVFIQVLILTVLLPISLFYLLRSLGFIKSNKHLEKKERRLPLAFYAILLFVLIKQSFSSVVVPELYYFFLGCLISTMLALIFILFSYKPSLHMMGITALTSFIISISAYYHITFLNLIAFFIVCTGFTASARLYKNRSSAGELILGMLIGLLPQVGLWFIWLLPSV
jgi:hypothetical protein